MGNDVIRKVACDTNTISTVAGTGDRDYTGDGGPATAATFNGVWGLKVDSSGNLLIADGGNNAIREIDQSTGYISTVVGTGACGTAATVGRRPP